MFLKATLSKFILSAVALVVCMSALLAQTNQEKIAGAADLQGRLETYLDFKDLEQVLKLSDSIVSYGLSDNLKEIAFLYRAKAYALQGNPLEAEANLLNLLQSARKRNDVPSQLNAYLELGTLADNEQLRTDALTYYKAGLDLATDMGRPQQTQSLLFKVLEQLPTDNTDPDYKNYLLQAEKNYNELSPMWRDFFEIQSIAASARLAYVNGDLTTALSLGKQALAMTYASPKTDKVNRLVNINKLLADISSDAGDPAAGLAYLQEAYKLRDAQFESYKEAELESNSTKFSLFAADQRNEKQEVILRAAQQEAKNASQFNYLLGLALLILASLGAFAFYSYRKSQRLNADLEEKNEVYLRAKEDSESLAKAKTQFLSDITHELRTPLYGIIGLSRDLDQNTKLPAQEESIDQLRYSAEYLEKLINDVLLINKLDSNKVEVQSHRHVDLERLLGNVVQSFQTLAQERGNTISAQIDERIKFELLTDEIKLSQVLFNLVGNANKFTRDGTVDIVCTLEKENASKASILIEVRDTGIGIPLPKQAAIFDEFTQVNRGSDNTSTGLGLPIAKKLLDAMGSTIELQSVSGEGATFSFTLEVNKGNTVVDAIDEPIAASKDLGGLNILAVDDNKVNRMVTKKVLSKLNANPFLADSGAQALQVAAEQVMDVILMDIHMPEMDGFTATSLLRQQGVTCPIIALTAVDIEDMMERIQASELDDIIVKPYNEDKFLEVLLRHVNATKPILRLHSS